MPPQENVPTRLNNPGDLVYAGQQNATQASGAHGFAEFPTPQDGFAGLLNDLQAKINRNPKENLTQFASIYAPESDGNNVGQYAANIANQLGVSPDTDIGSLQSRIGEFADAVAHNEGYQSAPGLGGQLGQAAGTAYHAVGGVPGVAVIGGAGALGAAALGAFGDVGALGEEALGAAENFGKGLFGKILGQSTQQQTGGNTQPDSSQGSLSDLMNQATQAEAAKDTAAKPSQMYQNISDMLNQTVGGQAVVQEGQNRGIDPVQILERTGAGALLQPDENGNVDKLAPLIYLNDQIAKDKDAQRQMVNTFTTPVSLDEAQARAEKQVNDKMADSPDRKKALKAVQQIFASYRDEQPIKTLEGTGEQFRSNYISPARLQKKKELLGNSERDFTKPQHERSAALHVKESMRQMLSEIAKREGVQGWDETNKRMESMILAKKAVKKLPKKASRNKHKEFAKDLAASVAGGLIGHTLGNSLLGTVAGHLVERQLGKREYKGTGTKKEQKEAKKKREGSFQTLLTREHERKNKSENHNTK